MEALLLGYGEIGKGMCDVLSQIHSIIIHDPDKGFDASMSKMDPDILLVAFPWSEDFLSDVSYWQNKVKPVGTIIFSTVPIGTCWDLDASHFPIEAKHPHITRDVRLRKKHVLGGYNPMVIDFLKEAGLQFDVLLNQAHSEFLKLRSTAIYGVNIEFARYCKDVADQIGLDWEVVKDYDQGHNDLVIARGTPEHTRYVLDPPEGNIGGHCVVPNARLLDEQFPSLFLKEIYRDKK